MFKGGGYVHQSAVVRGLVENVHHFWRHKQRCANLQAAPRHMMESEHRKEGGEGGQCAVGRCLVEVVHKLWGHKKGRANLQQHMIWVENASTSRDMQRVQQQRESTRNSSTTYLTCWCAVPACVLAESEISQLHKRQLAR